MLDWDYGGEPWDAACAWNLVELKRKDSGAFIDLLDQEHRCFCTFLDFF